MMAPFGAAPVVVPLPDVSQASTATLALFASVALAIAIATSRRPALAICAFIISGPFDFSRAIGPTTVTLPKAVLLGALLGLILRRPSLRPLLARQGRTLAGGAAALVLVTGLSALPAVYLDATARETLKALEYFLTFVCACLAFGDDPDETLVWNALAIATVLVCSIALIEDTTVAPSGIALNGRTIPRIAGPLEGPNQLAGWCDLVVPMLAARALIGPRAALFAALAVLALITDALTLSRSSYIGLVPGLAVVAIATYRAGHARRLVPAAACLLAAPVALATLFCANGLTSALAEFSAWIAPTTGELQLDNGLAPRVVLWRAAYRLWATDPALGIGAGNYELLTPLVGLVGVRTHANSLYLQSLAEGGVALFSATVWTIVAALALLLRHVRGPLGTGIAAATVALSVHQIFDYLTFYPKVGGLWWTLLGIGTAAAYASRSRSQSD